MILTCINQKGGVGKTACAVSLSHHLAMQGKKVLLVDCDGQHNSTNVFYKQTDITYSVADLMKDKRFHIRDCVVTTRIDNLELLPASEELSFDLEYIAARKYRETILKNHLERIDYYDAVIIDTNPSFDIMVQNAATAADRLLLPIDASADSLSGLQRLFNVIAELRQDNYPPVAIVKNKFNGAMSISNAEILRGLHGAEHLLCESVIRQCSALSNCTHKRQTIFEHKPKSNAAIDMARLSREIFKELLC